MESWSPSGAATTFLFFARRSTVGRRESCDIVLRFSNVSGQHCQLSLENGYWFVQDNNSQNGTKVNGSRIVRKRLDPGDLLSMAKHKYTIKYSPDRQRRNRPAAERRGRSRVGAQQVAARPGRLAAQAGSGAHAAL